MGELLNVFWAILIFAFGLFTLFAGLFTAYFGAGKSRAIGFTLSLVGVLGLLLFAVLTWNVVPTLVAPVFDSSIVVSGLAAVLGAAVGAIGALVIFLISIMKA